MNRICVIVFLTFFLSSFFEKENQRLDISVDSTKELLDSSITLIYRNLSSDTIFLDTVALNFFGVQNFIFQSKSITYNGLDIHRGISRGLINSTSTKGAYCQLFRQDKHYVQIPPSGLFLKKFNLHRLGYSGFMQDSIYTVSVSLSITEDYSELCPNVWNGIIRTESFQLKSK